MLVLVPMMSSNGLLSSNYIQMNEEWIEAEIKRSSCSDSLLFPYSIGCFIKELLGRFFNAMCLS